MKVTEVACLVLCVLKLNMAFQQMLNITHVCNVIWWSSGAVYRWNYTLVDVYIHVHPFHIHFINEHCLFYLYVLQIYTRNDSTQYHLYFDLNPVILY